MTKRHVNCHLTTSAAARTCPITTSKSHLCARLTKDSRRSKYFYGTSIETPASSSCPGQRDVRDSHDTGFEDIQSRSTEYSGYVCQSQKPTNLDFIRRDIPDQPDHQPERPNDSHKINEFII